MFPIRIVICLPHYVQTERNRWSWTFLSSVFTLNSVSGVFKSVRKKQIKKTCKIGLKEKLGDRWGEKKRQSNHVRL